MNLLVIFSTCFLHVLNQYTRGKFTSLTWYIHTSYKHNGTVIKARLLLFFFPEVNWLLYQLWEMIILLTVLSNLWPQVHFTLMAAIHVSDLTSRQDEELVLLISSIISLHGLS